MLYPQVFAKFANLDWCIVLSSIKLLKYVKIWHNWRYPHSEMEPRQVAHWLCKEFRALGRSLWCGGSWRERAPDGGPPAMKGRWPKNDGFLELGIHRIMGIMDSAYFLSVLHPAWEPNLYTGSVFGVGIQPRGLSVDVERFRFQQCGNGWNLIPNTTSTQINETGKHGWAQRSFYQCGWQVNDTLW